MTRTQATSKGMKIYSGTGTISAGTKAEVVSNNHVTANSKVLVEMTADMTPAVRQWVSNKGAGAGSWYNADWLYRKKITIDNTKVDATLTDFPVLVSLTTDAELAANARADGYDILFTSSDGETKLKHEIQEYTTGTGKLISWVKVTSVSSSADTDIYMYYGNSTAADQSDAENVWDANYKMVQHMKDTTTSTITDSTINANNGTKVAANEPIETASGQIGKAQDFDGSNDYIDMNTPFFSITDASQPYTCVAWIKTLSDGGIITQFTNQTTRFGFRVDANKLVYWKAVARATSIASVNDGNWHHVAFTKDALYNIKLYIDGVADGTGTDTLYFENTNTLIGSFNPSVGLFMGIIDEMRLSNIARTSTWISTEYNNQNDPGTFYSLGSVETPTAGFKVNTDANVTNNTTFDYAVIN